MFYYDAIAVGIDNNLNLQVAGYCLFRVHLRDTVKSANPDLLVSVFLRRLLMQVHDGYPGVTRRALLSAGALACIACVCPAGCFRLG